MASSSIVEILMSTRKGFEEKVELGQALLATAPSSELGEGEVVAFAGLEFHLDREGEGVFILRPNPLVYAGYGGWADGAYVPGARSVRGAMGEAIAPHLGAELVSGRLVPSGAAGYEWEASTTLGAHGRSGRAESFEEALSAAREAAYQAVVKERGNAREVLEVYLPVGTLRVASGRARLILAPGAENTQHREIVGAAQRAHETARDEAVRLWRHIVKTAARAAPHPFDHNTSLWSVDIIPNSALDPCGMHRPFSAYRRNASVQALYEEGVLKEWAKAWGFEE